MMMSALSSPHHPHGCGPRPGFVMDRQSRISRAKRKKRISKQASSRAIFGCNERKKVDNVFFARLLKIFGNRGSWKGKKEQPDPVVRVKAITARREKAWRENRKGMHRAKVAIRREQTAHVREANRAHPSAPIFRSPSARAPGTLLKWTIRLSLRLFGGRL